jgi:hypothetical protein
MKQSELSAKLHEWNSEYMQIVGENYEVPSGLWRFIASRIAESGEALVDDDVITVRFSGEERSVRITGTRSDRLVCESPDGSGSIFLCGVKDVLPQCRQKLTTILNNLERNGLI